MRLFPTMRIIRLKCVFIMILLLSVYVFISYLLLEIWYSAGKGISTMKVVLPYVVVHLDLKGAPPKLSYLEDLLPVLKKHGVNGLLVEYEDMFPYDGRLAVLRAKNCYDKLELRKFLKEATKLGIQIIPLIQTFGHMEFVLKLKEFQHLREDYMYPDSICPSKTESMMLIKEMLMQFQMMDFHENISPLKFVHIGCDEVFHINKCYECSRRNFSNTDLFIKHVRKIKEIIEGINPDTRVLVWDDMFRYIKPMDWSQIDYLDDIQTVYWDYEPNISVSHINMLNYHRKFNHIWIATAFKGADGILSTIPSIKNRFLNNLSWLKFIVNYRFGGEKNMHNFIGVILTGWSRYSHNDPHCELLPVSIPSLLLNLILIRKVREGITIYDVDDLNFWNKHLTLDLSESLHCKTDLQNLDYLSCNFQGNELYNVLVKYLKIKQDVGFYSEDEYHGLSYLEYYWKKNLVNMNNIVANMKLCNDTLHELLEVEVKLNETMRQFYYNDTIEEYINVKTSHLKSKLKRFMAILNNTMNFHNLRRPKNV